METIWDAEKFKQARIDADLSPEDAADRLNIARGYMYMIEAGTKSPSQKLVARICELYVKPAAHFLRSDAVGA